MLYKPVLQLKPTSRSYLTPYMLRATRAAVLLVGMLRSVMPTRQQAWLLM